MSDKIKAKIVDSIEKAYKEVNGIVVDLDKASELLTDFNANVAEEAKEFKTFVKGLKNVSPEGRKSKAIDFAKKKLYSKFQESFLDKFYPSKEYEVMEKDDICVYILGSFIEGQAKISTIDVDTQFKLLVSELTNRIYAGLFNLHNSQK